MRPHPISERIRIVFKPLARSIHTFGAHFGAESGIGVQALGAGHDFLPAHEEVVAVCEQRVGGVGVRVEGAEVPRVFVDGVEVCGVRGED